MTLNLTCSVHGRQPNLKRIQKYSIIPQEFNFKKLGQFCCFIILSILVMDISFVY